MAIQQARIIMVDDCSECPYQEQRLSTHFCYGKMSLLDGAYPRIPLDCPLDEIEIDMENEGPCDCPDCTRQYH